MKDKSKRQREEQHARDSQAYLVDKSKIGCDRQCRGWRRCRYHGAHPGVPLGWAIFASQAASGIRFSPLHRSARHIARYVAGCHHNADSNIADGNIVIVLRRWLLEEKPCENHRVAHIAYGRDEKHCTATIQRHGYRRRRRVTPLFKAQATRTRETYLTNWHLLACVYDCRDPRLTIRRGSNQESRLYRRFISFSFPSPSLCFSLSTCPLFRYTPLYSAPFLLERDAIRVRIDNVTRAILNLHIKSMMRRIRNVIRTDFRSRRCVMLSVVETMVRKSIVSQLLLLNNIVLLR